MLGGEAPAEDSEGATFDLRPGQAVEGLEEEDHRQSVTASAKAAEQCRCWRERGWTSSWGTGSEAEGQSLQAWEGGLDFILSAMGNPGKASNRSRTGSDYLRTQHSHYKF